MKNKRTIVFIVTHAIKPRQFKMALALNTQGFRIILICHIDAFLLTSDEELKCFSKICKYTCDNEAYELIKSFSPLVFHLFTEAGSSFLAYKIIRDKAQIGTIVFDEYDNYFGFYKSAQEKTCQDRVFWEKYCLENADGLCCRNFGIIYQEQLGYCCKGKKLFFLDYCGDNIPIHIEKEYDEISCVYAGGLTDVKYPDMISSCNLEMGKILEKHKIYYDIFPILHGGKFQYREFYEYSQNSEYFTFHETISYGALMTQLQQFSYGVSMFMMPENLDKGYGYYTPSVGRYFVNNKYFDYLDAGIPILTSGSSLHLFNKYLRKYGFLLEIKFEELDEKVDILKDNLKQYKESIARNRKYVSMMYQIPRLIKFYDSLQ